MVNLSKKSVTLVFAILMLGFFGSVGTVLADVPEVRSVVAWNDGGHTKLNVTIYHIEELPSHYVDNIKVVLTGGTPNVSQTFPQSGPHVLDQNTSTFNVTLDVGPLSDAPLAGVQAHCTINGWSTSWTGNIPEYGLPSMLLTLATATLASIVLKRKIRTRVSR